MLSVDAKCNDVDGLVTCGEDDKWTWEKIRFLLKSELRKDILSHGSVGGDWEERVHAMFTSTLMYISSINNDTLFLKLKS